MPLGGFWRIWGGSGLRHYFIALMFVTRLCVHVPHTAHFLWWNHHRIAWILKGTSWCHWTISYGTTIAKHGFWKTPALSLGNLVWNQASHSMDFERHLIVTGQSQYGTTIAQHGRSVIKTPHCHWAIVVWNHLSHSMGFWKTAHCHWAISYGTTIA